MKNVNISSIAILALLLLIASAFDSGMVFVEKPEDPTRVDMDLLQSVKRNWFSLLIYVVVLLWLLKIILRFFRSRQ